MRLANGCHAFRFAALVTAGAGLIPSTAHAASQVVPYLEVEQVFDAELDGGGDTLTYTTLAAGIDASAATKRTQAQLSYRYERHIVWGHNHGLDGDVHTGLGRIDYLATPDITLEAGGIAARARNDNRVATPIFLTGNDRDVSQIYGAYAGPAFAHRFGDLDVTARYRFGYVYVDNGGGSLDLGPVQPVLETYSHSTSHTIDASVGMAVGALPFAWTVSGGYQHESSGRLGQRYDAEYGRGDVTLPVTYTLAVTGGIGYEKIKATQDDILRNPDGSPVLTAKRHFVADKSAPRLLAYETDGLIYDAGLIWKPNRRTTFEAHAGKRYGEKFVTATLDYRINEVMGFQAALYNDIQSFGRQLTGNVAGLPTAFQAPINPLVGNLTGCVFGTTPGAGGCLTGLGAITDAEYRNRGVYALLSGEKGRWSWGLGAGYDQRKYLAPSSADFFSLSGVKDDSVTAEATATRRLSANSTLQLALYALWYDSGIADTPGVTDLGGTVTYSKNFSNHLSGEAAVGLYTTRQDGYPDSTVGSALLGLRYQF